jgi:hypothetical protein
VNPNKSAKVKWRRSAGTLAVMLVGGTVLPASAAAADSPVSGMHGHGTSLVASVPEAAAAAKIRNKKFNTYDYTCAGFSPAASAETVFIGTRHFVYEGYNWEESYDGGKTWLYAFSLVYPFGQVGPRQITKQWEYSADFSLEVVRRPCPPR